MSKTSTVACPTCGAPVEWSTKTPTRPFCCERCKLIDLGAWANESHSIPGDSLEDELFSTDLPTRPH